MSERNAETRKTRESEARDVTWAPPTALETPTPPEGFSYRWVRHELLGEDQAGNVYSRTRQHYEPVTADELAGFDVEYLEEGKHEGVVRSGDLILMKVPDQVKEQRNAYYAKQNQRMLQSVDQEMDAKGHPDMPWERDRKTEVSFGKRSAKIED